MGHLRGIATATLLTVVACGGRLAPLASEQGKEGGPGSADGSVEGGDGGDGGDDGASGDAGPPPLPVCSGALPECLPPDAGVVWHGSAVISCQPQQYVGPWPMVLERQVGPSSFLLLQKLTVYPEENPILFYDTTAPPTQHTYRVCSLENGTTALCGAAFTAEGAPHCGCEPTSCYLQTACNTTIDDQCMGTIRCGACSNGMPCNPENNTCCAKGFMSDGWGNCVCAPPSPRACPNGWDTVNCQCLGGGG